MGQCYDITFKAKMKNTTKAFNAIREWIKSQPWAEDARRTFEKRGIDTSTHEGLLRVIFLGYGSMFRMTTDPQGVITVDNAFDACYTQESRIYSFFSDLASFFEDGSSLEVWPDDEAWKLTVENGKCTETDI